MNDAKKQAKRPKRTATKRVSDAMMNKPDMDAPLTTARPYFNLSFLRDLAAANKKKKGDGGEQ